MSRKVVVVPPDPHWATAYRQAAEEICAALADEVVDCQHIGSTSIPGLAAKPIIDILVTVKEIARVDAYNERMQVIGFQPKGEFGLPGRRYFVKGSPEEHTHHVHVFTAGSSEAQRHLDFRDYLISHPDEKDAYSRLKLELAARFPEDIEAYMDGKDAWIKATEQMALRWRESSDRRH
jgi:GrpB-like predicted nucleotidyltransferase (UPF0157 family)